MTQENKPKGYRVERTQEFIEWLDNLRDVRAKVAIATRLLRIEQDGYFGDTKGVGDGVSELRFFVGAGYRVYYTIIDNTVVFTLYGGDKSTKKGQQKDIRTAKEILTNLAFDELDESIKQ